MRLSAHHRRASIAAESNKVVIPFVSVRFERRRHSGCHPIVRWRNTVKRKFFIDRAGTSRKFKRSAPLAARSCTDHQHYIVYRLKWAFFRSAHNTTATAKPQPAGYRHGDKLSIAVAHCEKSKLFHASEEPLNRAVVADSD